MTEKSESERVTAVMSPELKQKLQDFAKSRRWSMSQALVYFAEVGLEELDKSDSKTKS